jgi:predicted nucleic acid-binding protein
MKRLKLYFDTSVIGGFFDDEFSEDTIQIFNEVKNGTYDLVISDLTIRELIKAPEKVRKVLQENAINFEEIIVTQEAIELASEYVKEKVVGQTSFDDCIHIATATINKIDILVSWNFKHIVNIQRIRGYNSINLRNGYQTLEIRSPKDIINYENEKEI